MLYNVYLICAEINGQNLYKIGYTKRNIQDRINEFKTGNASNFYIVDSFKSKWGSKIEAKLHRIFKSNKVSGEWFSLNELDLENFKYHCQTIHNGLDVIEKNNTYYIDRGFRF